MHPQTLLVVDDHPVSRLLPSMLLKQAGHRVFECEGGAQALSLMAQENIDQVLLDVALPDMNGLEICRRIKQEPRYAHVRVVAYTAHALAHEVQHFLDAGFDAVLTKPVQRQDILGLVAAKATDG